MGEGIGVGFEDAMNQVSRDMRAAIPTGFTVSANAPGSYAGNNSAGAYAGANVTQEYFAPRQKAVDGWTEIEDTGDLPFDTDKCKKSRPIGGIPNGKNQKTGNTNP